MPLSAGETLGPYEILALIGEGGMGEVYKARDMRLDRTVALKVSKQEFTERFEREARAVAAVSHPNICQLFDVGPNYLVMEYIEGAQLQGPIPMEKVLQQAGQILDALDAAHKKRVTHRDLKPANILVTKQGIKLLDFGLAKQAAPLQDADATVVAGLSKKGQIVGTLQYMAPEQLQGKDADARSDLFAFGCVLYEMLSGKRAFEGANAASVIAAILEREPAPLEISAPLDRVIRRCLAKDLDARFQNALDLKYNLALAMEQPSLVAVGKPTRWYWAAAATFALGALISWVGMRAGQVPVEGQAVRSQLVPPEGGQFDGGSLAISPDGRTLTFSATVQGKTGLWVRPLDGTVSRLLPGTDGATFPFWSPDGASIAYFSGDKLWRVDMAGGAPFRICEAPTARGGAWGSDGGIVFGQRVGGLLRVPAAGGSPTDFTTLKPASEQAHRWPQMLPGSRLLYLVRTRAGQGGKTATYAAPLSKPDERELLVESEGNAFYATGRLFWMRGSTLVAQSFDSDRLKLGDPQPVADPVGSNSRTVRVSAAISGSGVILYSRTASSTQFSWVDRAGKALGNLGPPGEYPFFSFAPDGRRLVVARANSNSGEFDLWLVEAERNSGWSRFTFNAGNVSGAAWSPDSQMIIFNNRQGLIRKATNGAGLEETVLDSARVNDWSGDGRFLIYSDSLNDLRPSSLWILPMTRDGKPQPEAKPRSYLRSQARLGNAKFSPGEIPRWVAYTSDEGGQTQVYVQAFPEPQGKWQISTAGGRYPTWAPGGQEVFYLAPDNKLMAVSLKLGKEAVEPSAPRELFTLSLDSAPSGSPYAVAPDGKRFLVRTVQNTSSEPLQVISNWPALFKTVK